MRAAGSAGEQESAPRGRHARVHVGRSSSRPRLCQNELPLPWHVSRGNSFAADHDGCLSSDAARHAALGALLRRAKRRDTSGFLRASAAPPFDFASW